MPFIPLERFTNNATTTVTSGGTTAPSAGTIETWTVTSNASFPANTEYGAQQFHVADTAFGMGGETITVLDNTGGTTWKVQRGAESTTPLAHASGFVIVQVVTAGFLNTAQYPAWQFPVQQFGAQGDGRIGTGGTGTSGTNTFTDSGASFVNATAPQGDVGKVILIGQGTGSATVATNPFCGTITAVNSSTSVTLSANLGANCSSAPYIFGTDDAGAITNCVNAAAQWAVSTGNYKAQILFEPQNYMLGALTQSTTVQFSPYNTGSNYTFNTHIPIPFTTQFARKLVLDFIGVGDASEPDFWGSSVPGTQGTCLVSAVFPPSQPDATFGQMSVLGTPSLQTNIGNGGISGGSFANNLVNIDGISIVTPYNSQIYSFDFRWACQANVANAAAIAFAPVNSGSQTVGGPWIRATNIPSNGVAVALAMPGSQNNDNCNVGLFSAEGISCAVIGSEHFNATRVAAIYCNIGFQPLFNTGTNIHGAQISYFSAEGCNYALYSGGGTSVRFPIFIGLLDTEVINTAHVNDPNSNFEGTVNWCDISAPSLPGVIGASNLEFLNTQIPRGPWSGAPSAPASATAQQNTAYRHATVYASATTGITAVSVGPVSGTLTSLGLTGGNNVVVPIRVPSGHWYSVTYTGTPTVKWVLD